jgi:putative membrane protein
MKSLPSLAVVTLALCLLSRAHAADASMVTSADRTFAHKVGLGGMFEVDSSKLALDKASAQPVKDFAANEVKEHTAVGDRLKSICTSEGIDVPAQRSAKFQKMYDALKAQSGGDFDKLYIKDMKAVHATDGGLFAKEADTTKDPELKSFATDTTEIVQRHIKVLNGMAPLK